MTLAKSLKKLVYAILCCKEDDIVDKIPRTGSAGHSKPASGIIPAASSETSWYTAKTHLTPEPSAASYHRVRSSATSYHTAPMSRRSSTISRESSGGEHSLGNFTRSSGAMSRVSSTASDASDRNYWASRRQPSGIFGDSPEKKAHFKLAEMNFWTDDQKRSAWKTVRSGGGSSSGGRVRIPRSGSSADSSAFLLSSPGNRPGSQFTRSSRTSLSAWNSSTPMFM
jgi:hypothetical protein